MKKFAFFVFAFIPCVFAQADASSEVKEIVVSGKNLTEKLQWLQANAESNTQYSIVVSGNEKISPQVLSYEGKRRVTVRLSGTAGKEKVISLLSEGSFFSVGDYVTLILDKNVTLQNARSEKTSLIVNEGATLIMNVGSKICDSWGDGVYVNSGGNFTMTGGEISGNGRNGVNGAGSFTMAGGKISGNYRKGVATTVFTMTDGEISGNRGHGVATQTFTMEGGKISGNAGGVYVGSKAFFTMKEGEISGNTAEKIGGGVYLEAGTFTMVGGKISGNKASSGGGVYVNNSSNFTMTGGEIFGNTAETSGGGMHVNNEAIFAMTGGKIFGNTAETSGGGMHVNNEAIFTMTGGEISDNKASNEGGGVYVGSKAIFTMKGGEISGNIVSGSSKGNGGGVHAGRGAKFMMEDGKISGNAVSGKDGGYGGGVYLGNDKSRLSYSYVTFVMEGGEISGNSASDEGGGMYVNMDADEEYGITMKNGEIFGNTAIWAGGGVYVKSGFFIKTGGIIYGFAEGDDRSNKVKDGNSSNNKEGGNAMYISGDPVKRIETTAGPELTLNESYAIYFDCENETKKAKILAEECTKIGKDNSAYNQCVRDYNNHKGKANKACSEIPLRKAIRTWEDLAKANNCMSNAASSGNCKNILTQLNNAAQKLEEFKKK
ncbi:MAG: right-handed parallel beta-helix repeat-containing protein [Fibromonadaceae bacterium]|nr:right-handed parallel beta-helix repeat-containing protein [Fibromonadaceae bacterium]